MDKEPETPPAWEKCRNPMLPHRTFDGDHTSCVGQTWRRERNGKWEYKQDAPTLDDLLWAAW